MGYFGFSGLNLLAENIIKEWNYVTLVKENEWTRLVATAHFQLHIFFLNYTFWLCNCTKCNQLQTNKCLDKRVQRPFSSVWRSWLWQSSEQRSAKNTANWLIWPRIWSHVLHLRHTCLFWLRYAFCWTSQSHEHVVASLKFTDGVL